MAPPTSDYDYDDYDDNDDYDYYNDYNNGRYRNWPIVFLFLSGRIRRLKVEINQ